MIYRRKMRLFIHCGQVGSRLSVKPFNTGNYKLRHDKGGIMKDYDSLHQKVQEHIDCFSTSDLLSEMSKIPSDTSVVQEEASAKWIALAVLHGVNQNAEKIEISRDSNDTITVTAEYRKNSLPSPGTKIGIDIIESIRKILHTEKESDKSLLSLGVGNDNLTLKVKMKTEKGEDKVTFKFPKT